jgi:glycopeptide antibiotics resistance protein
VIVAIMIPIALLHFLTGSHYQGPFPLFVNGYLLDILIPFGFYFLLCLNEYFILKSWLFKGFAIFMAAVSVEIAQYLGIPLLGSTFDAMDINMYALGVLLAIVCDALLFPRLFGFWRSGPQSDYETKQPGRISFTWRKQ